MAVLAKVMNFLGLDEGDEIEENEIDKEEVEEQLEPVIQSTGRKGKVVKLQTAANAASVKIVIMKPLEYDDAVNICENLKNRKIVVVNTCAMEPKLGQRLVDFISGSVYSLGAELQEVEKGVFILSPSNVEVSKDIKNELSGKGLFNWTK